MAKAPIAKHLTMVTTLKKILALSLSGFLSVSELCDDREQICQK